MKKVSKEVIIDSFNVCGIITDDPEKMPYLKNVPNASTTEEIVCDNEVIDNGD